MRAISVYPLRALFLPWLADGRIRLVRWLDDEQHPAVKLLADAPLDEVLRAVRAGDEMRVGERADVSV